MTGTVLRCLACCYEQFMILLRSTGNPVATCQNCGRSYELQPGAARPVTLMGDQIGAWS
jgi:transcription elongation factor Elf1